MPTVNIFYQDEKHQNLLAERINAIKSHVAAELTCGDIALEPLEVSVRLIKVGGDGMIASLEVEVTAHAFPERIEKQDEICLHIRDFLLDKISDTDIRVWLLLPQLGHSWEG